MVSSRTRAATRLVIYLLLTVPLMPVQALLMVLRSPWAGRLPLLYHRLCCWIFGIELIVEGEAVATRPTLFVANHISYLDIEVLSAVVETSFVAKREIASWPFFGWLARLQRTVFVERRRHGVEGERDELARHLEERGNIVLFAEGTSGDGNRLLPFKSALFSVAERKVGDAPLVVQPVTIAYTRLDGMPLGRPLRPFIAWYGDMDLAPHLWFALGLGRITAVVRFHPPVTLAEFSSRKALAGHCQQIIGAALEAANLGRHVRAPT
ncbi:MAG: 1-acyl-sn-glycerol-3-phosphate acyltransferase [Alphaproteobacteria bacterium]|nr:1-acyl-sn-glycerol-3-phosphate acyltransferase [Alphaproteobacteria bacterium]